jgi:hypothetical protein
MGAGSASAALASDAAPGNLCRRKLLLSVSRLAGGACAGFLTHDNLEVLYTAL